MLKSNTLIDNKIVMIFCICTILGSILVNHIFLVVFHVFMCLSDFTALFVCSIRSRLTFLPGNAPTFPRLNVWDPYKRLGISPYASEEEIWGSRNFLLQQYAGHERSEESIEAAFEKLLMTSFKQRKKTKINLKSRLKKQVEESPPWIKNLLSFVELPPKEVIFRRLFLFAFMGGWSIMNSAEGGPAFQVCSCFKFYFSLLNMYSTCKFTPSVSCSIYIEL